MRKAVIVAALTGVFGLFMGLVPFGYELEEGSGLGWLFKLRGERRVPPLVLIVSEDQMSSARLNLPRDPRDWPRAYHARLIRRLARDGARVIVFDHFFGEPRSRDGDRLLAQAIGKAGNVVLTGTLEMQTMTLKDSSGKVARRMTLEKLIPPTPVLARQALSFAPFPLPKVPVTVSRYWTFKPSVGVPTLPVVVMQAYALQAYGDFIQLLKEARARLEAVRDGGRRWRAALDAADNLIALDKDEIKGEDAVNGLIRSMRKALGSGSPLGGLVLEALNHPAPSPRVRRVRLLRALVRMYRGGDNRYLNYYGPAQTITTVPYAEALERVRPHDVNGNPVDFRGKVVFVGESNANSQRQGDYYHTFYSRPDGLDLSGVEIAATAFANLSERSSVHPVAFSGYVLTLVLFGVVAGLICYLLNPMAAAAGTVGLIFLYVGVASFDFVQGGLWLPVVVPATLQAPFAFVAAVLWKYLDARKVEAAHERLKEIDRLKTLFLSQVSHELKTPLSSIKGFVDNMLDGLTGELHERQHEYLLRVRANTNRLSRMISNLLDLSRIESGTQRLERAPLSACELVEEAVQQFHLIAESRHVSLAFVCPDPTVRILADHDKFIQVITNLVDNAIKFTPAGGRVTAAVARQGADRVLVTVTDTGSGIPVEVTGQQLFEPFYQARPHAGGYAAGLGLGLSIVKTLVELHDGAISVHSEEGKGAEFRILVPAYQDETACAATGSPAAKTIPDVDPRAKSDADGRDG